jgi:hypothetical protein
MSKSINLLCFLGVFFILTLVMLKIGYNYGQSDKVVINSTGIGLAGYAEMHKPVTRRFLNEATLISLSGQPTCGIYDIKLDGQWYRVWTNVDDQVTVIQIKRISELEHEN